MLYLLDAAPADEFLAACRVLLRSGGRLVLKEVEARLSWKYWKILLQERFMVHIARKMLGNGPLRFEPRHRLEERLRGQGFRLLESLDLSKHYSTPHVLLVGER